MARIITVRNILKLLILTVTLATVGVVASVAGAHLRAQIEDVPKDETALLPRVEQPGEEGLTVDRIRNVGIGIYLQLQQDTILRPMSSNEDVRQFVVEFGESATSVAQRLEQEGFIADADLFRMYMRYHGIDVQLEAGAFEISAHMNMQEIGEALQQARVAETIVTIPEGWRAEQVAEMLDNDNITDGQRFLQLVNAGNPEVFGLGTYAFLADRPSGRSLEGYLFPDTYRLPASAEPEDLLARMLDNFAARVTAEMTQEAQASGLSVFDLVTLASIVEREAVRADERPLIASVYLNRLNGACEAEVGGPYLQADPTVQYARGAPGNWWWKPESVEEYQTVQSPYNTYLHPGLPPGPISNPGLSAIMAVIRPQPTAYCFFVATGADDGSHVFAETLAEHNLNVLRYQQR